MDWQQYPPMLVVFLKLLRNKINGVMINAGNVTEIIDSLVEILSDSKVRSKYGKAAYQTIREKFNAEGNIERMVNIYSHLIEE